ncbi:amidohydrolase family protein [Lentisphaerota bacterium ZTH]|nr:amidohydrolase family protein [Lentisphaerota bacterium]WET07039.1 amidohydrolase family protein [Lentisphaerota bacterium ZTH]
MIEFPGFIELQQNGYLGVDFSDQSLTEEDFVKVSKKLLSKGIGAFVATIITSSEETYRRNLPLMARAIKSPELQGRVLGIHAEGPFLSSKPGAIGAHNPDWVKKPGIEFFKQMQEWAEGNIRILTLAAENEGAVELTKYAAENGVAVSLGHQMAGYEDMKRCAEAGATLLTHLGNGIPNEIDRHKNQICSGLACNGLTAMIITDGHHLPPELIKVIIRAKGLDNTLFVSDASPIAGMPPGKYFVLGNNAIIEENGLLHNPEKRCLVGSSATMFECANFLAAQDFITPEEVVQLGFANPLKAIGIAPEAFTAPCRVYWDEVKSKFICS